MRRLVVAVVLVGLMSAACGGGSSSSSPAKYCDVARSLSQEVKVTASTDFRATFAQFDSFADKFLAAVPTPIKEDANTVISGIRELETALRAVNFDVNKLDVNSLKTLSDPKFTAAGNRLADYNSKNCGITTPTT